MSTARLRVDGWVWCDDHCGVHEDSTDPYRDGYGCRKSEHRTLYANRRKYDNPEEKTL